MQKQILKSQTDNPSIKDQGVTHPADDLTVREEKKRLRKTYRNTAFGSPAKVCAGNAPEDKSLKNTSGSPEYTSAETALNAREELSRRISERLLSCPEWREAETVFCYVGTGKELDTTEILEAALREGKRLAVPKIEEKGLMTAREIKTLRELAPGVMGIPEPAADAPVISREEIGLVIVPGLAFDSDGYRLGYGGGFYDRFLDGLSCVTIGLCPEARLLGRVPREPHDEPVRTVITESRIWRTPMKKLLITCFEPFGGETVNASMEAVMRLPDTIGGWSLTKCRVPVVFKDCAVPVLEALKTEAFDAVILVGQAAGRKAVTPEMFAHNLRFARIPDNAGQTPMDEPIADGPLALSSTAGVRKIARAIQDAGIPAQVSYSAGAYVCNDLYYQVLYHNLQQGLVVPVCFIHVPSVSDGFSYEELSEALQAAIKGV